MANRNRNRGGGGGGGGNRGGGGGGDNKIAITAGISGKRSDCKITVILRKGRFVLPGETLMFRLGTVDNPHGPWIMDTANSANRYVLATDADGEVQSVAFDFAAEDYKHFTQVLVVYYRNTAPGEGVYEQAAQLPAFVTTEGPKAAKKGRRLVCQLPEGSLKSRANKFTLPTIRTLNKDGKAEAADLIIRASEPVSVFNTDTGKVVARGKKVVTYKTPANGLALLEVQFAGMERTVTVLHPESGEEISLQLTFEY